MSTPFFHAWRAFLAPMGSRVQACRRALSRRTLVEIEQRFAPALDTRPLRNTAAGPNSRTRLFTLERTFWSWIWQLLRAHTSCREVVAQLQALLLLEHRPPCDENSAAYCQARARLPLQRLLELLASSVRSCRQLAPATGGLQGRPVKLADGTSFRLQDSPPNRAKFPPAQNQFGRPSFPLLKLTTLFCLKSGAVLAHALDALSTSELRLFMRLRDWLRPADIVVADRAYGVFVVVAWLKGLQCDLIARLNVRNRKVDFRKAERRLGPKDGWFRWFKPGTPSPLLAPEAWAALPVECVVRLIHCRVERPGFRTRELTVMTTLLDPQLYPAAEILEAYCRRWRLEMSLDDLKTTLGMEQLRCKSPELVERELVVLFITHNLIRWLMIQAASAAAVPLERISFTGTLDAFRQWAIAGAQMRSPKQAQRRRALWEELLKRLAADAVPFRPGRREPRAVKKRCKYPPLNQPRHAYVEPWSRNQRRRAARAKAKARVI